MKKKETMVFILKAIYHAEVPREDFQTQNPSYTPIEGQRHSAELKWLPNDLSELNNTHLTQTTCFTDEDQGNHSQGQSYK